MTPDDFDFLNGPEPEDDGTPDEILGGHFRKHGDPDHDPEDIKERQVTVAGVYEHRVEDTRPQSEFIVILKDSLDRSVVMWIGKFEAMAISLSLEGESADRPLTHDLLSNIITKLGAHVDRILIDDLWNSTYYAKVVLSKNGGEPMEIDSRPSDAIALALRSKAPIFMAESVLERAKVDE